MMLPCVKETEKMDDIDSIFSSLLGEMDHLSQSLMPAEVGPDSQTHSTFSIGFTDLNESLNELEDHDLDALVADLRSKSTTSDGRLPADQQTSSCAAASAMAREPEPAAARPRPSNSTESSEGLQMSEPQTKAEKIKLALEKLKEAKVRKLIVKVLMSDGSSKTLMVDERQTVREVLDKLFEKTHCDCSIDWSLCETNPELQIERDFEDHEHLVEPLSAWTRVSENQIYFVSKPEKYVMFTDPQLFYMWKKKKACLSGINEQAKQLLLKEHFGGSTLIVPDLEGKLYLKEDGKKLWKPLYFMLRASGIYYVPKGKTKAVSDLACFLHFEKVNIYTTKNYKQKYRAPTNFCFMLKHPCLQKESHYMKFLCCDDEHTLLLWVNSIRIAKYGTVLFKNYQAAMKRASSSQPPHSAAHKDRYNSPKPDPAPPKTTNVEDYPHEPPPDFIPPPPPGQTHV
ncbi:amyloid beta A4 precursor protein-binding family B member 1-interacting protein-like [Anarrhichthys ocellatus]|uniref:amyloid beta A4 precursor protein-binding family B member 1-interacting protein-like n=1 Tax=Anarrhichthys ocellatus TaxID=433405 RepID=UPI0012ED90C9|nr:amyloid beta A4 precursor protein-binding family B member 1-interacting protein-like [Anarrhichthys ocellatus]